jgi:hypothetical protein
MGILKRPFATVVMTAACFVSAPIAHAQQSLAPSEQAQPTITDQKLNQTATAAKRVASVNQNYHQLSAVAPPSERQRIAAEWVRELTKAITEQGLSVEEYYRILELAQRNPDLREKIEQLIRPSAK